MKKNLTINQIRAEKARLEKALLDGIYGEISKFEVNTGENVKGLSVRFATMQEIGGKDEVGVLLSVSADVGSI